MRIRYGQVEPVDVSEQQLRILAFVMNYAAAFGWPPDVRTIGRAVGLKSFSSVHAHLKALRRLGLLDWEDGKARTLRATVAVAYATSFLEPRAEAP